MSNVLFVGDLRPAYNYGAIATTEALLDMIYNELKEGDAIEIIDHRSFHGTTPIHGWDEYQFSVPKPQRVKRGIVKFLKTIGIYESLRKLRRSENKAIEDNIPNRLDEYENFTQRILQGETWEYEKRLLNWADLVIINSEGNIVNGTDEYGRYRFGGRYLLFLEYLTKKIFKKKCYVINHTVDPKNRDIETIISAIYPLLDGILVREKKSLNLLMEMGVKNASYTPDALWARDFNNDKLVMPPNCLNDFDFSKDYICIGDSSGIENAYGRVKWDIEKTFERAIHELKRTVCSTIVFVDGFAGENEHINQVIRSNGLRYVNLTNCNYHELYYVLSHSKLFISGRWHASIIALLGHTPVLLWGSDSHKTEALYDEINYPYVFFDVASIPLNIDRITTTAKRIIYDNHNSVWSTIEQLKKLALNNVYMLK